MDTADKGGGQKGARVEGGYGGQTCRRIER